tara:strand:- start:6261 stop:6995 length:735 start_codon:yes stop_codon:yes gene_type:complete
MTLKVNIKKILSLPVFAALLFMLIVAASIVIVSVAATGTDNTKENNFPEFKVPTATNQTTIYAITQVENNQYTLSPFSGDPPKDIELQNIIPVELLEKVQVTEIEEGFWLTVIGVPDPVRSFRITALVIMEVTETVNENGIGFSKLGFTGAEGFMDGSKALKGGQITSMANNPNNKNLTITLTANKKVTNLVINHNAPLYRLQKSGFTEVDEGKTIVIKGPISDSFEDVQAILILDFLSSTPNQ